MGFIIFTTIMMLIAIIFFAIWRGINKEKPIWGTKDDWLLFISVLAALFFLIGALLTPIKAADERIIINNREYLANYIATYNTLNETDKALLNQKKYEFNKELLEKKAKVTTMKWAYIYANELLNLELLD